MRTKRASRLAACTAIVLSAGMLLAGPASADTNPAGPHVAAKPAKPQTAEPSATRPQRKTPYGATAAAVPRKPRFDLDKDGNSDLLYQEPNGKVYLEPWKITHNPEVSSGYAPAKDLIEPGDIDGDGNPELFVVSPTGTLALYSGLYATPVKDQNQQDSLSVYGGSLSWSSTGWNAYNKLIVPGDLTGDGKADLLARTPSGDLYLYPGTGSLTGSPFGDRVKVGSGWGIYDQIVGSLDMNNDGIADIVARTPGGDLFFYAGSGSAATPLKDRVKIGTGWNVYNQLLVMDDAAGSYVVGRDLAGALWYYGVDLQGGLGPRGAMNATGWNGSVLANAGGNAAFGKGDLLGLDTQGSLYYYYALGNGTLADRRLISDVGGWAGANVTFTSSLRADSRWGTLLEVGGGHLFVEGHDLGAGWDAFNGLAGVGDLTGEGNGDLLARGNNGHMYLYPGNGQATGFYNPVDLGAGWNGFNKLFGAGDVNGDGIADLLARDGNGHLFMYPGKSTPGFGNRIDLGGGWNGYNKLATPGDMTGDGRADLIGVDGSGTAWRYDANGTGAFKERVSLGGGWNTYNGIY